MLQWEQEPHWLASMRDELQSMESNRVWWLVRRLQKPRLKYHGTYAPVAKLTTIRRGLIIHQMDVKTAFQIFKRTFIRQYLTVSKRILEQYASFRSRYTIWSRLPSAGTWSWTKYYWSSDSKDHDYCLYTRSWKFPFWRTSRQWMPYWMDALENFYQRFFQVCFFLDSSSHFYINSSFRFFTFSHRILFTSSSFN